MLEGVEFAGYVISRVGECGCNEDAVYSPGLSWTVRATFELGFVRMALVASLLLEAGFGN